MVEGFCHDPPAPIGTADWGLESEIRGLSEETWAEKVRTLKRREWGTGARGVKRRLSGLTV